MNSYENTYFAGTAGSANVVGPDRIWRFTTKNFAAKAVLIPRRTWSRCVLDAIPWYIVPA